MTPVRSHYMPAKSRNWWLLGLLAVLLGYLVYRSRHLFNFADFSAEKFWQVLRSVHPIYLLFSILLIYVCYFLRAVRWQGFQKHVGNARLSNIFAMTLAGFTAVFLLGRAGEPVRPLLISRKDNIPLADTFGIYALERLMDTAFTAILAAVGLLVFTSREQVHAEGSIGAFATGARTAATALCLGVFGGVVVLVYLRLHGTSVLERRMHVWVAARGWRARVAHIVLGFVRGVQTIRTWGDLLYALVVSTVHWVLVIAIYYLVSLAFGGKLATLTFQDAMLVLVFTMVGSAIQLPGVGGGSQALTILAYTSVFRIDKESAVAVAEVLWLITFAMCSLAGIPLLFKEGWSLGELRRMREHEDEELDAGMARNTEN